MTDVAKPLPFTFDGIEVYNADELREYDSNFFYGCSRGIRKIIERKKIDVSDFKWGSKHKSGWKSCSADYPKGKLLLKADWVHENVPKMVVDKDVKYEYEEAPAILHLKEHDKFKDVNGVALDIEVRGERHEDKCYFKVKDVSKAFDMDQLHHTIIENRTNGFEEAIDYQYFTVQQYRPTTNDTSRKVYKKTLYLSYSGMLRVLFSSRSKNAHKFRKWATEKLFTLQMGTKEQKQSLVSDALGVTVEAVREVFKKSSTSVPCVYLFALGTVVDLRKAMSIDSKYSDDDVVYKYGMTKDLVSRTQQHQADYGKISGVSLKMKYYSFIDPQYISEAETDIKTFFNSLDMKLEYDNRTELVIIKSQHIEIVKKQYQTLSMLYAGHVKELVQKIKDLEKELELKDEKHKNAMELKDERFKSMMELKDEKHKLEIMTLEKELELKNMEIKMRDNELASMKRIRELEQQLLQSRGITF
jgi:hypothetical protein